MIDYCKTLNFDWFEELKIEKYSDVYNSDLHLPTNYEEYDSSIYFDSFSGLEKFSIFKDLQKSEYIIRQSIHEPIGDYGWHWVYSWYRSIPQYLKDIETILDETI